MIMFVGMAGCQTNKVIENQEVGARTPTPKESALRWEESMKFEPLAWKFEGKVIDDSDNPEAEQALTERLNHYAFEGKPKSTPFEEAIHFLAIWSTNAFSKVYGKEYPYAKVWKLYYLPLLSENERSVLEKVRKKEIPEDNK